MGHYWQDNYSEMLPDFTNHLLDYYKKVQSGELELEDLKKDLWEFGGVKFEED